jgi:hypothetical protein
MSHIEGSINDSIKPNSAAETASNLQREADAIRSQNGPFSEQYNYFNSKVQEGLDAKGMKNNVAAAWALQNFKSLDADGRPGLSIQDLEKAEKSSDRFTQIMAKAVKDQYDQLRKEHVDLPIGTISENDLKTRQTKIQEMEQRQIERERKLQQDATAVVMDLAVVRKGEGLWHVAARVLGYDRKQATPEQNTEIGNLTQQLLVANSGRSALKVGEQIPVDRIQDKTPFNKAVERVAGAMKGAML